MFKVYKKEIEVAGKKISLETGKVARQADGAIIASCGETVILATVVGAKKVNPDMDYFPLSVNYQEKYYAGGKIPGGYFKREARPLFRFSDPNVLIKVNALKSNLLIKFIFGLSFLKGKIFFLETLLKVTSSSFNGETLA